MKQLFNLFLLPGVLFIACVTFMVSTVCAENAEMMRLRLRWGGEYVPAYGEVRCSSGAIQKLTPISMFTDTPGGAWVVNGVVQIRQEMAKKYNGFDISVPYKPGAFLSIQISEIENFSLSKRVDIPLDDLVTGSRSFSLSETLPKFQCAVNRVPGDMLQVQLARDSLVFAPRDTFQCSVFPTLCFVPVKTEDSGEEVQTEYGELEFFIYRGRGTFEIGSGGGEVAINGHGAFQLQFQVPEEEGVYDVVLKLYRKKKTEKEDGRHLRPLKAPFGVGKASLEQKIVERRIQFIVLSATKKEDSEAVNSQYTLKMEIDPGQPKWWENLDRNLLRQFRTQFPQAETLQNKQRNIRRVGAGGDGVEQHVLEIPQTQTPETNPAWEAFPLVVETPGMPYVLELEYLSNREQTFSVSVLEPNSANAISPPGIDSGVNVPPSLGEETSVVRLDRHHVLFWAQSRTPMVLVVNRHTKNPVYLGKIRLFSAGMHFAPQNVPQNMRDGIQKTQVKQRLVAMMIGKPMFAQAFSSSEVDNDPTGLCVSDWMTFYTGGNRMIEYAEHVGYNGVLLTAYADGSTIYPSSILNPTPRYDNGTYFPTAQDPVRKDILEMLFRMFDRRELKLIPGMDFSSPIPLLETATRFPVARENRVFGQKWNAEAMRNASGMRWRNPQGRELVSELHDLKNGAPYYNILNPVVQETVLQSIAELVRRYGHHPSFGGVSLQLHADSFLVLPGVQWGMTPENVRQFAQETGTVLPGNFAEQVQYLTYGKGIREWLQWRARHLLLFYRRVATLLGTIPDAKLYLNGLDLFQLEKHPELMPRLNGILTAEDVFLYFGLDLAQLKTIPNLVVNRPQKILSNRPLAEVAGDLQWAQTPGTYRVFQEQKEPGAMFYHAPEVLRLESFDEASPFNPTFTWMATTFAQTTVEARRPYAEALAMLDAFTIIEGGSNPVFGKEEALRGMIRTLTQLPAVHFNSAMSSAMEGSGSRAIIFRNSSAIPGMNYAYAVNTTPFSVKGCVYVQPSMNQMTQQSNPFSLNYTCLEDGTTQALGQDARGVFWEVNLEPYQIAGIRFAGAPVILLDSTCEVPMDTQLLFQREYAKLQQYIEQLKMPSYYIGLKNPGFERSTNSGDGIAYWDVVRNVSEATGKKTATATLDSQNVIFGDSALCLRSSGDTIRITSLPFEIGATGRLTIHLWMRTEVENNSLPLRLIVEGNTSRGKFYRTTQLSGTSVGGGHDWKHISVHVNDLPLEKAMKLSLGFELCDAGCVWIDNVQLSNTHFSEPEIQQLRGIFSHLGNRIAQGDIAPCVSALECYWMRFLRENIAIEMPPESSPLVDNKVKSEVAEVEYVPTKKLPQLPHLGQLPTLPPLPQIPKPKFPGKATETTTEAMAEPEKKKDGKKSYFEKVKNLLPW